MSKTVRALGLFSMVIFVLGLAQASQSSIHAQPSNLTHTAAPEREVSASSTSTFYSTADTTVALPAPTTVFGDQPLMAAGATVETIGVPSLPIHSLVKFGHFGIPYGQEITRGTLRLYVQECDNARTSYPIEAYRIASSWTENTTWNTQPSRAGLYDSVSIPRSATGWYTFDVTALVREWYNGTYANHGITLRGQVFSQGACFFATRESTRDPQLVVEYRALPPTLHFISPNYGWNNGPMHATIRGDYFQPGAWIRIAHAGERDIEGSCVFKNRTEYQCDFDLTGAKTGRWNFYLTNPDGGTDVMLNSFTIEWHPPELTSITPAHAPNDGWANITDLAGGYFREGATVKLLKPGQPDIQATNAVVATASKITCDIDLTHVATGTWDVQVTNPEGQSATLEDGFTVDWAPPQVHGITPGQATNDGTVHIADLAGDYFIEGATVKLVQEGETDLPATSVVVVDRTQITCDLDLAHAITGTWDVVVTNPDGQSAALEDGFAIEWAPPQVSGIHPSSGPNSGPIHIADLAGDYFLPGTSVKLTREGEVDLQATGVVVVGQSQITCDLDLTHVATGPWNVVVTHPDGQSATLEDGFTVEWAPPRVDGIHPSRGANDRVIHVSSLAGDHFRNGATVKLSMEGQADLLAADVVVVNRSLLTFDLDLNGAATGAWDVVVTNPDGLTGSLAGGFTVSPPGYTVYLPCIFSAYSAP